MKHTFKIIYETDGMPICPDAIHKQLDLAMDDIKKQFSIQYYTLPGLHKLYLEPCGDWFPEEQKPIRFELQAPSGRVGPRATSRGRLRAVREQASVDVTPVIRGQWRHFAVIGQQAEDRG